MKDKKYKMLVLSDLKATTDCVLKNSVSLSKMIDTEIEFFHVKKPTNIIERESQLSAMHTINKEHIQMDNKLQNLLESVTKNHKVKINHKFTFGNVKTEIERHISVYKPDIIMLGKRRSNPLFFIGDNITDFILKNHDGVVMIAAGDALKLNKGLSLGVLNNTDQLANIEFSERLLTNTSKPLKCFKITKGTGNSITETTDLNNQTVEFNFKKSTKAVKNLYIFLNESNVNLLCVDRGKKSTNKTKALSSEIKSIVKNVDVSLLFSSRK